MVVAGTHSKLPLTWEDDRVLMAKRIAALMEMHKVHPSLVINLDQTGANLVPSSGWTYEKKGSAAVAAIGAEDKRRSQQSSRHPFVAIYCHCSSSSQARQIDAIHLSLLPVWRHACISRTATITGVHSRL